MAALLQARSLLGLATGRHLRDARAQEDPLRNLQGRLEEAELKAQLAAQRFRIVEIKRLLRWTREEAATTFLVCQNTISNWEAAVDPDTATVGSTVKPVPPVVRLSDAVRSLARPCAEDLERRLVPALWHNVCFRPHQGLHGATPAEVFLGLDPACQRARRAPRGQPGTGDRRVPFRIGDALAHERLFPILVPAAAA